MNITSTAPLPSLAVGLQTWPVDGRPTERVRTAVLFRRFGPYHHARLNGAGTCLAVWGLEACGMDSTYAWEKVEGARAFTRVTLTDRYCSQRSWRRELHRQVTRALNQLHPDVVAIPGWGYTEACSALLWCLSTGTPAVLMSESCEWDAERSPRKEWVKRRVVANCSAALAGGTPHRQYLAKLGMAADRVFLGYDAVDNDHFGRGAEESRKRKVESGKQKAESGNGLPERYFLASARFVKEKNLGRLLEAYARYRSTVTCDPWGLVLLGDGPLRAELAARVASLGLKEHVFMPGFKQYDELPAYYGLASAFVHASTVEPWGLVVNEAMAAGLPVLVSNRCGCAKDLVYEGINGFTFDPYNIDQLAHLMFQLSAFNFQLSTPSSQLSALASASKSIIADWGPDRFSRGLQQAVEVARNHPRPRVRPLDRLLLQLLLLR